MILVTVPNTHWVHKHVAHRLLLLQTDGRYPLTIQFPSHKPYENNLHHIVYDFRHGDWSFWLNIDSDNPPMNNPLDLVELNLDLIGLPTPVWHNSGEGEFPIYLTGYDWDEKEKAYRQHPCHEGLQEVDGIGTGCFLMSKRVVNRMSGPIFERTYDAHGRVELGNDMAFCRRAKEVGVKIYAHYDYQCRHFSEIELREAAEAIRDNGR